VSSNEVPHPHTGRREYFYRACTDSEMGFKEFHFSSEENPNLTEKMKKELLEELGPEEYEREIRANWGERHRKMMVPSAHVRSFLLCRRGY